ncbi:MAG: hypothetical protein AAF914_02740 [Pseudomonadota bacterium]
MEIGFEILMFGTLGFAVAFGYISARATQKYRLTNPPRSALARDKAYQRLNGLHSE